MGEFFRGWNRKTGCITLLMALVFMGGWVRSLSIFDMASSLCGTQTTVVLYSIQGSLSCGWHIDEESHNALSFPEWETDTAAGLPLIWENDAINWRWKLCGFGFGIGGSLEEGDYETFCVVPYWSLTIPLTLISAFLLLSKPRKSIQRKIDEPIPTEGT